MVEYVVDPGGRVDTSAVRAVAFTHPDFVPPIREALAGVRFTPGRRAGAPRCGAGATADRVRNPLILSGIDGPLELARVTPSTTITSMLIRDHSWHQGIPGSRAIPDACDLDHTTAHIAIKSANSVVIELSSLGKRAATR